MARRFVMGGSLRHLAGGQTHPVEAGDGRWTFVSQGPSVEESDWISRSIAQHGLPRVGRPKPASEIRGEKKTALFLALHS